MNTVRTRIRSAVARLAARLMRLGEEHQMTQLRKNLGHCGANVVLRAPLCIEGSRDVRLEDGVSMNPFIHIWGQGGVRVGARTMIASHTAIVTLTHDPDHPEMHSSLLSGAVDIANDVWIGAHSVIMPGVSIGEHAVVGAGAVVLKNVPPFAVVAGVPAKVIRMKPAAAPVAAPPVP